MERKLHYYLIIIGKTAPDDTWPSLCFERYMARLVCKG